MHHNCPSDSCSNRLHRCYADRVHLASSSIFLYTTQQQGCCRNHDLDEVITLQPHRTKISIRGLKDHFSPVHIKELIATTAGGACTANKLECNEAA